MHIPDGLMDPTVSAIGWLEFVAIAAFAIYVTGRRMDDRLLPRVAILSAGIFVAQMLNFPVGGGTTGHLIGGALFAILAGPAVAIVGMTVVIIIQALIFGDGGLTALGLNAVNMAVIAPLTGWGIYSLVKPVASSRGKAGETVAVAAAAWASVFVAACACAAELAVSYAISGGSFGIAAPISIPAMLGYHAVIGVGEAAITVGVIVYLAAVSPGAFSFVVRPTTARRNMPKIFDSQIARASGAILVVFALALPFYFLYSSEGMDGLEQTMADGDVDEGEQLLSAPLSYGENYFTALFAGLLGFLAVSLAAIGVLKLLGLRAAEE